MHPPCVTLFTKLFLFWFILTCCVCSVFPWIRFWNVGTKLLLPLSSNKCIRGCRSMILLPIDGYFSLSKFRLSQTVPHLPCEVYHVHIARRMVIHSHFRPMEVVAFLKDRVTGTHRDVREISVITACCLKMSADSGKLSKAKAGMFPRPRLLVESPCEVRPMVPCHLDSRPGLCQRNRHSQGNV